MKAHGNGNPETCAANLLRIVRGEIAYDRVRGRDPRLIDNPSSMVDAVADAEWLLENYEPRVEADLDLVGVTEPSVDLALLANITRKEAEG